MDGPYEDELRRCVRDIAKNVEEIELHDAMLHDGCTARGQPPVTVLW